MQDGKEHGNVHKKSSNSACWPQFQTIKKFYRHQQFISLYVVGWRNNNRANMYR